MTTRDIADGGSAGRLSDGRLGARAAVTPIAMYGAWIALSGWGGSVAEFALAAAEIAIGAVVAGWIVGGRMGRSIPGHILGLLAYGFVGSLVLLPLNVAGSTLGDVQAHRVSGSLEVVIAVAATCVYGLVTAIYVSVFLLPFGAAWIVTVVLLRRALER